jgi:hypothetical protein
METAAEKLTSRLEVLLEFHAIARHETCATLVKASPYMVADME